MVNANNSTRFKCHESGWLEGEQKRITPTLERGRQTNAVTKQHAAEPLWWSPLCCIHCGAVSLPTHTNTPVPLPGPRAAATLIDNNGLVCAIATGLYFPSTSCSTTNFSGNLFQTWSVWISVPPTPNTRDT